MLSRRILIFASRQLYWTCRRSNASCGRQHWKLTYRNMGFPRSFIPGILPVETIWTLPVDVQWNVIVTDFALRRITAPGDKLLASRL